VVSDLSVRIDLSDRLPVVSVVGDVDHHSWSALAVLLANVVHAGNERAIVDLSGVASAGRGALEAIAASVGRGLVELQAPALRFARSG
jgi:anti-anti-sigma regulatory factor